MTARVELAARIEALRAEGYTWKAAARTVGVSLSYAFQVVSDPSGEREAERKRRYGGVCVDCGARTSRGRGAEPAERCASCAKDAQVVWTQRAVLHAIRLWRERYGFVPSAMDWSPSHDPEVRREERRRRFYEDGEVWPSTATVVNLFGSWNAGVEAAGFERVEPGTYRNACRRAER